MDNSTRTRAHSAVLSRFQRFNLLQAVSCAPSQGGPPPPGPPKKRLRRRAPEALFGAGPRGW
eukprot:15462963-Alexandrium_andersonii.AAC.1